MSSQITGEEYIKLTQYTVVVCGITGLLTLLVQMFANKIITIIPYVLLMCGVIACYVLAEKRENGGGGENSAIRYFGIIIPTVMSLIPIMIVIFTILAIGPRIDKYIAAKKASDREPTESGEVVDIGDTLRCINSFNIAIFMVILVQLFFLVLFFTTQVGGTINRFIDWLPPISIALSSSALYLCSQMHVCGMTGFADG